MTRRTWGLHMDVTTSPPAPTPAAYRTLADEIADSNVRLGRLAAKLTAYRDNNLEVDELNSIARSNTNAVLLLRLWSEMPAPCCRPKAARKLRGGTDAIIKAYDEGSGE